MGISGLLRKRKAGVVDMLLGQYEGKIGAKSRIAMPKKFREVLGDKLIITL